MIEEQIDLGEVKVKFKAQEDPWKHRAKGMRCNSCIWFVLKQKQNDRPFPANSKDVGRCRRHAPTISGYPVVFTTDWCGDHRIDENKI